MDWKSSLLAALLPHVVDLLALVATLAAGWITRQIVGLLGDQATKQVRERLHSAIENGLKAALVAGLTGEAAKEAAADYAQAYQKGAVKKLRATRGALKDIATAKMFDLTGAADARK